MVELREGYVQAGDYRTHYVETGSGKPVLMLHSADPGSGGAMEFRHNIGPFGEHFRVVAPDIIGFGKTDPPLSLLTHPAYVEHMLAFIDAIGLQDFNLVGNSRGGLIAISVAAERPAQVGRMVLAGNAGGGIPPEMQAHALSAFANYTPSPENIRTILGRSYFDLDRSVTPEELNQYLEASKPQYESYARVGGYPMDVPNLKPLLAEMKTPVLFFFGKDDKVFAIEQGLAGFVSTPGARFFGISNCGHHPQSEYPKEFNALAIPFLKGELEPGT
ncbi:MAG: bphD [Chloroflexi bacterium]|nr:bphD [Chloroflexota bacterium]